ncbi:hypothetical protein PRIPAC_83718 [Pristionchus pacificus]|uniref:Uncharacterized protein n=1 Tax=Pristionchus pacificus TaxID=54126 RepID=A0A2A6BGV5_PRIPA|nr:hypothetical protein PRIPAC_83718 [Pristionchus pacificus]|eukprot:PDM65117.1 hypothetical protein PRIPAC_53366 [Pristionchus pacificus]
MALPPILINRLDIADCRLVTELSNGYNMARVFAGTIISGKEQVSMSLPDEYYDQLDTSRSSRLV